MSQLHVVFALYPRKDVFLKNVVPKESFFFVASDVVAILYNKPCICTGD